jgi:hypothetical protein
MARTRRELIDLILDNLGVLVPGQAPGDEAVSRVDAIIDPSLATLAALGVIYVADAGTPNPPAGGEIEDAVFIPLGDWIAWQVAGAFHLSDSASLKALSLEAEKTLRIIGRPASTRRTLSTDLQLSGSRLRAPMGNFTRGT